MDNVNNTDEVVKKIIARYGGREAILDDMQRRIDIFNKVWDQDTDRIGRVLRAHLTVEHFVTEYLVLKNPKLGSLEKARLSYAQKIDLLDSNDPTVNCVLPGLRLLGTIRNRMSHRLRVELSKADEDAFLGIPFFNGWLAALNKHYPEPPIDDEIERRLVTLEKFARVAAALLHASIDPNAHIWVEELAQITISTPTTTE